MKMDKGGPGNDLPGETGKDCRGTKATVQNHRVKGLKCFGGKKSHVVIEGRKKKSRGNRQGAKKVGSVERGKRVYVRG